MLNNSFIAIRIKITCNVFVIANTGLNCRNEDGNVDVIFVKNAMGLGFCIEGGMGSLAGDRPISIKKIFGGK